MTDDAFDKEPVRGTSDVGLVAVGLLDLTGVRTLDDLVTMGHIRMVALGDPAFLSWTPIGINLRKVHPRPYGMITTLFIHYPSLT